MAPDLFRENPHQMHNYLLYINLIFIHRKTR